MYGITGKHYAIDDDVLPILDLHPAFEPRIDIEQTCRGSTKGREAVPMFAQ